VSHRLLTVVAFVEFAAAVFAVAEIAAVVAVEIAAAVFVDAVVAAAASVVVVRAAVFVPAIASVSEAVSEIVVDVSSHRKIVFESFPHFPRPQSFPAV